MFTRIKYGRNLKPGVPLCRYLRNEAIELAAAFLIREIGRRLRIQPFNVSRYVKLYRDKGSIDPAPRTHMRTASKLSLVDSILLETLVESKGSTSLKEIKSQLSNFGGCGELSISTISRHVRNKSSKCKNVFTQMVGKVRVTVC